MRLNTSINTIGINLPFANSHVSDASCSILKGKKKCRTCFLFLPPRVRIRADGLFISAKNRLLQVIPRGISQREKAVMGFSLTHLILRLFFLLVVGYISTVSAAVNLNVTIYYNDSSISYSPPGAWNLSAPSNLDLGGAHMLTQNPNATASFNFTGKSFFSSFLFPFFSFFLSSFIPV